jgi:threonine dehydratase
MTLSTDLVTLADVLSARDLLAGVTRVTPMERSRALSARVGGPVLLKCENLQRTGSFKIRGAYTRIARLAPAERARGVVAASAGNHAQGVALAAASLGIPATVFMPTGAALPKVAATRGYGATVRLEGDTVDDSLVAAQRFADETGAVFIHPFDHRDIVAGQGTVGLEIVEQCPDVQTVLVCTGGGGLVAGVAAAVKGLRPDARVIGVQAAGAAAFPPSLVAGRPVALPAMSTIADGIAVGRPGDVTFRHVAELVDDVVTVSEEDISGALLHLLERAKLVVEPAGAVALAALLGDAVRVEPPVVTVLSGGNIDPLLLLRLIEHGLSSARRYLSFTVKFVDRPGSLAAMLALVAEQGANVLDVSHARTNPRLHLGEVDVALSVETKGAEHSDRLVETLRGAGYRLTFV